MGFFGRLLGRRDLSARDDAPFMEHPTGEFATAREAICSAMHRLDQMGMEGRWITFSGQGRGFRPDAYQIEDVLFSGRTFDLGAESIDLESILHSAGLSDAGVAAETSSDGKVTLASATPEQLASFLDTLFKKHFGIGPFEGKDDYAVGAEW